MREGKEKRALGIENFQVFNKLVVKRTISQNKHGVVDGNRKIRGNNSPAMKTVCNDNIEKATGK